jgi:hypothetical protein
MPIDRNDFFARTMHTPDSPERAAQRAALREISKALIPLHRALIEAVRDDYSFAFGHVGSPGRLLQLVNDDPFFAWLKPLTSLIVDIDEMARVDFEHAEAMTIADRVERMFGGAPDPAFAERYVPLLQRDVDIAVGHASVRRAVRKLRV